MEALNFISAVLGIVAAVMNRKQIVVIQHQSYDYDCSTGTTLGKRLNRCLLSFGAAFLLPSLDTVTGPQSHNVLLWVFAFLLLITAYQFVAMLVLMVAWLWR